MAIISRPQTVTTDSVTSLHPVYTYIMAAADVLDQAHMPGMDRNHRIIDCCWQNKNDIPIKDDTVAENWAKN